MQLLVEHDTSVDRWLIEHHYLHSVPAGAVIRMRFEDNAHRTLGCMLWGRPSARALEQSGSILQLTRMCFVDDTEACIESRALAMARKYIRKHYPTCKGLLSYSSTGEGHVGTIYRADNWYLLGRTQARRKGWTSRAGRTDQDGSIKLRWTRSP